MSIEGIRRRAIQLMPYAARAFYTLEPVPRDDVPHDGMCDSHWRVYYNEGRTLSMSAEDEQQAAFRMCRDVARLLQGHPKRIAAMLSTNRTFRRKGQQVASLISTAVANSLIRYEPATGEHLAPEDSLTVTDLPGCEHLLAKEQKLEHVFSVVWNNLEDDEDPDSEEPDNSGGDLPPPASDPDLDEQSQQAAQSAAEGGQSHSQEPSEQPPPRPTPQQPPAPQRKLPPSSSATDGEARPWELPPPPATPNTHGMKEDVARRIVEHEHTGYGDVSRAASIWARDTLDSFEVAKPRDLVSLLESYSETQAGYHERRYDGRNRRQASISAYSGQEICLARNCGPKVQMLIVLDTSGSMSRRMTRIALQYIGKLLQTLNLYEGAHFYTGDTTPEYRGVLTPHLADTLDITSEGGTHMPRVLTRAREAHREAGRPPENMVVCVTDGLSPWDMDQPNVPFVVVIVPREGDTIPELEQQFVYGQTSYRLPHFAEVTFVDVQEASQTCS